MNSLKAQDVQTINRINPKENTSVLLKKAEDYARTGNDSAYLYIDLIKTADKELQDSSLYLHTQYLEALMLIKTGRADSARELFKKCTKPLADSSNMDLVLKSMNALTSILYMEGRYKEALSVLNTMYEEAQKNDFLEIESKALNNLGLMYKTLGDYPRALRYYNKALELSLQTDDSINYVTNLNNIGIFFRETDNYQKALEFHNRALEYAKAIKNNFLKAVSYEHLAELMTREGNSARARSFLYKALEIYSAHDHYNRTASVYLNIAELWFTGQNYEKAYELLEKAEASILKYGYSDIYADLILLKGKTAAELGLDQEARTLLKQVEVLASERSQNLLLAETYKARAQVFAELKQFEKAFEYSQKYARQKDSVFHTDLSSTIAKEQALFENRNRDREMELLKSKQALNELQTKKNEREIRQKTFFITGLSALLLLVILVGIYLYYTALKNKRINKHLELKNRIISEQNSEIIQQNEEIRTQTDQLFNTNKELIRFKTALENTHNAVVIMDGYGEFLWVNKGFTKLYGMTKDEFRSKNLNIFDAAEASDKAAGIKQKLLKCIEDKTTEHYEFSTIGAKGKRVWVQTTITPLVNEQGEAENLIAVDSDITEIKHYEDKLKETAKKVLEQKNILQKQNMEINAAIRYAGTIQKAILPIPEYIKKDFDFFLIYKPKEIVSGDFYWFSNPAEVPYVFIAVTDCTGHGVPGAFMSMIGTRLLNSIVNEKAVYDPAEILEQMHNGIKQTLKQHTTGNMDGMDISLCRLEPVSADKKKVIFSGAKQSAFYYSLQSGKITKVRGDIKTIGGLYYDEVRFTNKAFVLQNGDMLYLTSDGIIDQNAPDRKKFGTLKLIRVLEKIAVLPLNRQREELLKACEKHRSGQDQRDDVSFLGLRI